MMIFSYRCDCDTYIDAIQLCNSSCLTNAPENSISVNVDGSLEVSIYDPATDTSVVVVCIALIFVIHTMIVITFQYLKSFSASYRCVYDQSPATDHCCTDASMQLLA